MPFVEDMARKREKARMARMKAETKVFSRMWMIAKRVNCDIEVVENVLLRGRVTFNDLDRVPDNFFSGPHS